LNFADFDRLCKLEKRGDEIFKKRGEEDLPMIIPGQFGFNCPSGFREEAF
jgi:hypothetical protein